MVTGSVKALRATCGPPVNEMKGKHKDGNGWQWMECGSYRGEAEGDVEVLADAREEVLHDVLLRELSLGELSFHDGDQFGDDLALLVAVEQIRYRSR